MATVTVSSSSGLLSALKNAAPNTTIALTGGTYTLSARGGQDFHGAVVTAARGADVTFSRINLNDITNLDFQGVEFRPAVGNGKAFVIASSHDITIRDVDIQGRNTADGYGTGHGLWVSRTDGFTLENSTVSNFQTGLWIQAITDLKIGGNTLSNISLDGMIVGGVHNAYFYKNTINLHVPPGAKHTDGMQFYNSGKNDPSSDFAIRDNVIKTHNGASHGIYLANGIADDTGRLSSFYEDLVIKRNVIVGGQVSGIAVGQVDGLSVYANTVLQDPGLYSTRDVKIPVIRVHADSTHVEITSNITHRLPEASGANWFPTRAPEPGWTIANNKHVALRTALQDLHNTALDPFPASGAASATMTVSEADTFHFATAGASSAPEPEVSQAELGLAEAAVHDLSLAHAFL